MSELYSPPASDVGHRRPGSPMKPVSPRLAIILGGLIVDTLGTLVLGIALGIVASVILAVGGASEEAISATLEGSGFLYAYSALGLVMTISGGYVACTLSPDRGIRNAAGSGALSLAIGLSFALVPGALEPLWLNLSFFVIQIPAAMAGGGLAMRRAA